MLAVVYTVSVLIILALNAEVFLVRGAATFATDLGLAPEAFLMAVAIGAGSQVITFGAQAPQAFVPGGTFARDPVATASSGLPVGLELDGLSGSDRRLQPALDAGTVACLQQLLGACLQIGEVDIADRAAHFQQRGRMQAELAQAQRLEQGVGALAPVIEIAGNDHRRIGRQAVEQLQQQAHLALAV